MLGNRILGKHETVETLVLRTPHPRIYILAHHILECLSKGNHILGNRILGNHDPENYCAQYAATKNLDPGTPHSRTPYLWQPYPWKPCIPGDHCAQNTGRSDLRLAEHTLVCRIQDNRVLGNRILGNHVSLESIVLRNPPTSF